ncbi:hypothetical protein [Fodinicurvata sediminis]|uniref:hypothetical protein n=1 Tax=Fodinicurvata sediminis TaxID=1121832 RepID=UPI0003B3B80C|nr:hypothetical protein [Fodinicurvata sediminis]
MSEGDRYEISPELATAMERARERGRELVTKLIAMDGMLPTEEFAQLLGVSSIEVEELRKQGIVLALRHPDGGDYRFPAWQLDAAGNPIPDLQEIFIRYSTSPLVVWQFLHNLLAWRGRRCSKPCDLPPENWTVWSERSLGLGFWNEPGR